MTPHGFSTLFFLSGLLVSILGSLTHSGCSGSAPYNEARPASDNEWIEPSEAASASSTGMHRRTVGNSVSQYPRIVPQTGISGTVKARFRFSFEEEQIRLNLKIPGNVLEGAKQANKYAVSVAGNEDSDWREKYNLAFIEDPAQKPILDELHQTLLQIAKEKKLDSDRTAELLTAFVQQIEYDDTKSDSARFPVETLAEKTGDCDDKSRLLVALLIRSGFNVATFYFSSKKHMAVGIKSNGLEYRRTGYSYIETTSPSLIGFPFSDNANVQLHSMPLVQRIGTGKRKYGASEDVAFISQTLKSIEAEITRDQKKIDDLTEQCHNAARKLENLQREMKTSPSTTQTTSNQRVRKYNQAVDKYNGLVNRQQNQTNKLNQKIELRNFIVNHTETRYTTVKAIRQKLRQIQ
jgi:hypothetical protein